MEFIKVGILLSVIVQVSQAQNTYIVRNLTDGIRHCIRIYDCPPGNEILPCKDNYSKDLCQPCAGTMVQPLLISSSEDMESTKCFTNKDEDKCMEKEVRPSRLEAYRMCGYHTNCECATDGCYYGDPCVCSKRGMPCDINETMNGSGECFKCPTGTEKNQTGCGPCTHIIYRESFSIENPKLPPDNIYTAPKDNRIVKSGTTNTQYKDTSSSSSIMAAIIAALAVFILAALVLLVIVLKHYKTKSATKKNDPTDIELIPMNILNENVNQENDTVQTGPVESLQYRMSEVTNNTPDDDPLALPYVITKIFDENDQKGVCKSDGIKKYQDEISNKAITSQERMSLEHFQGIRDAIKNKDKLPGDVALVSSHHQTRKKDQDSGDHEPNSAISSNEDSINSCLEYHNYEVKGEQHQSFLTKSTHVITNSKSLSFSADIQTNGEEQ